MSTDSGGIYFLTSACDLQQPEPQAGLLHTVLGSRHLDCCLSPVPRFDPLCLFLNKLVKLRRCVSKHTLCKSKSESFLTVLRHRKSGYMKV